MNKKKGTGVTFAGNAPIHARSATRRVAHSNDPVSRHPGASSAPGAAPTSEVASRVRESLLVVGGLDVNGNALSSLELFDPSIADWRSLGDLLFYPRLNHTATPVLDVPGPNSLPGHAVIIAGGVVAGAVDVVQKTTQETTVERFDVSKGVVYSVGRLSVARSFHTATLVGQDSILVAGGMNGISDTAEATCEIYDPQTFVWTPTGNLNVPRFIHTATGLTPGSVLVAGGFASAAAGISAEIFTEATGSWTRVGDLNTERLFHTATRLLDGRVLVTGGVNRQNLLGRTECEIFDPVAETWSMGPDLNGARAHHTATLLPDGSVIVVGGVNGPNQPLNTAEILDSNQLSWTEIQPLYSTRVGHTTNLLNGQAFVVGGGEFGAGEIYDQVNNRWSHLGILKTPRGGHSATPIFNLPNPWVVYIPPWGWVKSAA